MPRIPLRFAWGFFGLLALRDTLCCKLASSQIVLGIDLGTTNSACAVVREGRAAVVRRGEERIIPSVVAALPGGRLVVGDEARRRRGIDPAQVVWSAKRLLGRRFSSPEVQRIRANVPYRLVEGPNESILVEFGSRQLSVVEISAQILDYLRQMAEEALGQSVQKAVIAVRPTSRMHSGEPPGLRPVSLASK